ncbi:MAG: acylphosphatase [Candidatus Omnitrophica bacterium]|nr:acylphosphatase [Candidatus Omnitrophota bacterium]
MSEKKIHIKYYGMVQGVGFRWTAERAANSLGLSGWVRNCKDGTVEVVCEGDEKNITSFLKRINETMGAYIKSVNIEWQEATGEFDSFNIRFH